MVFGAGGGTSSYREIEETDLIVLWGSNARETHPIFFHHLLRGVRNGAKLYTVDPRRTLAVEGAVHQDGKGFYLKGEFSDALAQHWRLTLTGVGIGGDSNDFLGQFSLNSHLSAGLRFSF